MKKSIFIMLLCILTGFIYCQTTVKLKLPNNCYVNSDAVEILQADKSSLELFPNPNSGNFTLIISFNENINKATISVYSTNGKTLYTETVFSNSNKLVKQIKINNLKKGTYLFEVKNTSQTVSSKLIINK